MQKITKQLISIIIPCYNAENFITETIYSVINQSYTNIEVIVIDDGSTDNSKSKIEDLNSNKLHYIHQLNQGVSIARNNGLKIARGEYILFLDADDIISANFLLDRFNHLELNPMYGACSSTIEIIDGNGEKQNKHYNNAFKVEDLTTFNPNTHTCPSGYLYRHQTIINHKLFFNSLLSSSADKLFLYDFFNVSTIGFIDQSPLLYRVYGNSMSNNLTEKLVLDHVLYLNLIIQKNVIPTANKSSVVARINYTIGASYFHLKKRKKAIQHLIKSAATSPTVFFRLITKQ